jgi:hypothetical protein
VLYGYIFHSNTQQIISAFTSRDPQQCLVTLEFYRLFYYFLSTIVPLVYHVFQYKYHVLQFYLESKLQRATAKTK